MPIEFDDEDIDETGGGGKGLRSQLERTIATNQVLTEELSSYKAKDFLAESGFSLVKPEDLKGVDASQFEEHAAKVHEDRRALQEDLLRDVLRKQGLAGDDLDDALEQMIAENVTPSTREAEATQRARALGSAEATPIPKVDVSKVHGFDAIAAGLDQNARKRARSRS